MPGTKRPGAGPHADELRRIADEKFGWPELRPEQLTAMEHVVAGRDSLVVLPSGAGKSAIYQVPALLLRGPTIVVSPLVALQRDQVAGLDDSAAPEAVAVNSAQSRGASHHAWNAIEDGEAEYLFLAPEQLAKDEVIAEVAEMGPSLFVVDEAHCVSSWGHDFRPEYLRLGEAIERLDHPAVLALTATAAPPTRADIVERLGLKDAEEVIASFNRPNLYLEVVTEHEDSDRRQAVIDRVAAEPKPGLVYAATRKDTEFYTAELTERGMHAGAYHAGMKAADRSRVQQRFTEDELDVVVATSAFGMGIDKPNVRFVFHAAIPDSLDSYYQEIGRAGRDDEPADAVLFGRPEDLHLQRFLTTNKPQPEALGEVTHALHEHDEPVSRERLKEEVDLSAKRRTNAVNLLEQAEVVQATSEGRLDHDGDTSPEHAVDEAVEVAEAHQRLLRSRIEMIRGYTETADCRRQYLLGYFGEQLAQMCGYCDNCRAGTSHEQPRQGGGYRPDTCVRHERWGSGVVLRTEEDRVTVLFADGGYRTLSLQAVRDQGLLTPGPDVSEAPRKE